MSGRPALTVHHCGPDPAYVGGMGSVIHVLVEDVVGADAAVSHPSWRPDARFASVPLATSVAWRLTRLPTRDVIHVHISERGSLIREGAIVVVCRLLGRPTVVTIHGADFLPFARRRRRLSAVVLRCARAITCLDRDVLALVRQLAPHARVELIPNAVAIDAEWTGAAETEELVLFAGEIGLRKGADVLQRAWPTIARERPRARCIMVGPGNDFSPATQERLEVHAPVDSHAMKDLLRRARVVALPSRAEGMPMILTEAMSAARPFVSTPVGGIPELARHGGVLVPVDDADALAQRLIDFLADPARASEVGEQGRRFCVQTRSTEVVGSRMREVYRIAQQQRSSTWPARWFS